MLNLQTACERAACDPFSFEQSDLLLSSSLIEWIERMIFLIGITSPSLDKLAEGSLEKYRAKLEKSRDNLIRLAKNGRQIPIHDPKKPSQAQTHH